MKTKFIIQFKTGCNYEVTEESRGFASLRYVGSGDVTDLQGTHTLSNIYSEDDMVNMIQFQAVKVIQPPPIPEKNKLHIKVDSLELDKALATAKELEATLLRAKELLK